MVGENNNYPKYVPPSVIIKRWKVRQFIKKLSINFGTSYIKFAYIVLHKSLKKLHAYLLKGNGSLQFVVPSDYI